MRTFWLVGNVEENTVEKAQLGNPTITAPRLCNANDLLQTHSDTPLVHQKVRHGLITIYFRL